MLYHVTDEQVTLLYFTGLVAVCSFNVVALLFAVKDSRTAANCSSYEHEYRAFKWGRCTGYAALVALQLPLSAARLASHWLELSWIDGAQLLVLLLYIVTLVGTRAVQCSNSTPPKHSS